MNVPELFVLYVNCIARSLSQQFFLDWIFLFFVKDNALEKNHELSGLAFLQSKTSFHECVITQMCRNSILLDLQFLSLAVYVLKVHGNWNYRHLYHKSNYVLYVCHPIREAYFLFSEFLCI